MNICLSELLKIQVETAYEFAICDQILDRLDYLTEAEESGKINAKDSAEKKQTGVSKVLEAIKKAFDKLIGFIRDHIQTSAFANHSRMYNDKKVLVIVNVDGIITTAKRLISATENNFECIDKDINSNVNKTNELIDEFNAACSDKKYRKVMTVSEVKSSIRSASSIIERAKKSYDKYYSIANSKIITGKWKSINKSLYMVYKAIIDKTTALMKYLFSILPNTKYADANSDSPKPDSTNEKAVNESAFYVIDHVYAFLEAAGVNRFARYAKNITEENCNGRLTHLYKLRDKISQDISDKTGMGADTSIEEKSYNDIVDIIDELCAFRRSHKCLIEGDPGYRSF